MRGIFEMSVPPILAKVISPFTDGLIMITLTLYAAFSCWTLDLPNITYIFWHRELFIL